MPFLAPGETNPVWILEYLDYDDHFVVGIYTSEADARENKEILEDRNYRAKRLDLLRVTERQLNEELEAHYWWEIDEV